MPSTNNQRELPEMGLCIVQITFSHKGLESV